MDPFEHNVALCPFCKDRHNAALAALDALTLDLDETKRSLRIQATHAAELEKAEVAQSARIAKLESEMRRYLPVIERAEQVPGLWGELTAGTGIATANGYRAALAPKEAQG